MIIPKEEEVWEDSKGYKCMTFIAGYKIGSFDKHGNIYDIDNVVHGKDGWKRVYPGGNDDTKG